MKVSGVCFLITGGAGFIGKNLSCTLANLGYKVRVLDNMSSQVHEASSEPAWIKKNKIEFCKGSVTNKQDLIRALDGITHIIHLAAETGTGQSMYEIEHYFDVNVQGTAILLDLLQNHQCARNIKSIVVASSRAIYGEGSYHCNDHGLVYPSYRTKESMEQGKFEPCCPLCSSTVITLKTDEKAPLNPSSIYGLTKQMQEQSVLMVAKTLRLSAFALRYQNVYGPGQSLKNPYTGILAVFSNLARQNQSIEVYEDGLETRDFVYIDDAVRVTIKSSLFEGNFIGSVNVGGGESTSVLEVAKKISEFFGGQSQIKLSGAFRVGDIRHNLANIDLANKLLGYSPSVKFDEGLDRFLQWAVSEPPTSLDGLVKSSDELRSRGLLGYASNEMGKS